jgi:hypothetical protein
MSVSVPFNLCSFGSAAQSISPTDTFEINRERAIDYLNTRDNVYVFDGYAGVRISTFSVLLHHAQPIPSSGIPSTESRFE